MDKAAGEDRTRILIVPNLRSIRCLIAFDGAAPYLWNSGGGTKCGDARVRLSMLGLRRGQACGWQDTPEQFDRVHPYLDEIIRRIVSVAQPDQVILFGSVGRGQGGPDSDLDFLVVKSGAHHRRLAQQIYRTLFGIPAPVAGLAALGCIFDGIPMMTDLECDPFATIATGDHVVVNADRGRTDDG